MVGERQNSGQEPEDVLKDILDGVVDDARKKLHNLFGPLEESGINREQFEELQEELKEIDDPTERARRTYEFYKKTVPEEDLPDEFNDFLKKK